MKIGVVGSGAMGSGIAQVAATAGHEVLIYDNNPQALEKSRGGLWAILNKLAAKGKIDDATAKAIQGRLYFVENMEDLAGAGLIIEAVVENLDVKKSIFAKLDAFSADDCILATNTSSLSVTSIAAACKKPDRVLGLHFFNPAPLMKLVEVVPAMQSNEIIIAQAKKLMEDWGKLAVLAKDTPGFIVNRVARPFYGEALRILEEGVANVPTIDWAMTEIGGFRMGPFTLMDFIGNDVNYAVTESVFNAFYYDPRYKPAFTQKRLVEAGWLGRKSGRGYYNYAQDATHPQALKEEATGRHIFERILVMLINEAADALFLNIASRDDLDLAMTKGVNYPKGLLKWADDWGLENCVAKMDLLYDEYREDRYRCSPLLRRMAAEGRHFYDSP